MLNILGGTKITMSDDMSEETREKRVSQVPLMKDYKEKCGNEVRVSMFKDKLKVVSQGFHSDSIFVLYVIF